MLGKNFQEGASVMVDGDELEPDAVSQVALRLSLDKLDQRPAAGTEVSVRVKNPEGVEPLSKSHGLKFL